MLLHIVYHGVSATDDQLRDLIADITTRCAGYYRNQPHFKHITPIYGLIRLFRRRHSGRIRFVRSLRKEADRFRAINEKIIAHHFATIERITTD